MQIHGEVTHVQLDGDTLYIEGDESAELQQFELTDEARDELLKALMHDMTVDILTGDRQKS